MLARISGINARHCPGFTAVWTSQSIIILSRRRDMSELRHPSDRPRRSRKPMRRGNRMDAASKWFRVRIKFGQLQPCGAPPTGRRGRAGAGSQSAGFWCGVWARGGDWQLNKPANLSSRGRGYRRDLCRYPTQTLGAHRGRKRAAPRAASLNSGSPRERRISASCAPRRAPAPPPPPRHVRTHIPDMRAAPPPPPSPPNLMLGARRFYAVERSQLVRRRR